MISKSTIINTLKQEFSYLKSKYYVKKIGIFGSFARDEQRETSDVDIIVDFSRPIGFFIFLQLEDYISEKLGIKVDLVTPEALKPLLKEEILEETIYV